MTDPTEESGEQLRMPGDRLRERVYVTFTAIAVLIAISGHGESPDPAAALFTLLITVVGVLLAGFTADAVSSMLVHQTLPSRKEVGSMLAVSAQALGAILVPTLFLVFAVFGVMQVGPALRSSIVVLLVTLGVIVWLAVRRAGLAWWKTLMVLVVIVGLGVVVVLLEYLAHTV
jgi:hypothetical protein